VPVASSVGLVPGYNSGAYLGTSYNPFQTGGDPNNPAFSVQNLTLPGGVNLGQLEDRRKLLGSFDRSAATSTAAAPSPRSTSPAGSV